MTPHEGGGRMEPRGAGAPPAGAVEDRPCAAHVTSLDSPVYAISGLPEEVVAVVLAFVSRSPHGFRENLDTLLERGDVSAEGGDLAFGRAADRARAFHERWVVGYGHASVAEHAVVHLGVERISRLASAELELANRFISFTEYSQRYQPPARAGGVTPPEVERLSAQGRRLYARTLDDLFAAYGRLLAGLAEARRAALPRRPDEPEERYRRRLERAAFEDARYALPVAWTTSLGLTANARALRDAAALLAESPYAECRDLAARLVEQASRLVPTLLRHAEPALPPAAPAPVAPPGSAEWGLAAYEGRGEEDPEAAALTALAWAVDGGRTPPHAVLDALAGRMEAAGPFADPPSELRCLRYAFNLSVSEAAWHQLLRHRRQTDFYPEAPSWDGGVEVPPRVREAGLTAVLEDAAVGAAAAAEQLAGESLVAARYLVTGAHRRTVRLQVDLAELTRLVRLRLRPNAQWDVRRAVRSMAREVRRVHPFVARLWGEEAFAWRADEGMAARPGS
jgi:thymidylate synthase ThyX